MKRAARSVAFRAMVIASGRLEQLRYFDELERFDRLQPASQERRAMRALADILRHAASSVPYYRHAFEVEKITLRDIEGDPVGALGELPVLDKGALRRHSASLLAENADERSPYQNSSGGSTGEPARFVQDRQYLARSLASASFFETWTGYRRGDPRAVLWGAPRDTGARQHSLRTRISRMIRNERVLNSYDMTPAAMDAYVDALNDHAPRLLVGYAESLFMLARHMERTGRRLERPPDAVISSANMLHPHMRHRIEEVLDTQVFDRYGSREFGAIGFECPLHEGRHVNPLTHHVEVRTPDGAVGRSGEGDLLVSGLNNYSMPLLRYEIGDRGRLRTDHARACGCGRAWPTIETIIGRSGDQFVRRDGSEFSPVVFVRKVGRADPADLPELKAYQLRQHSPAEISVLLAPYDRVDATRRIAAIEAYLSAVVREAMLDDDVEVHVELVDEIPVTEQGKHRYAIRNTEA